MFTSKYESVKYFFSIHLETLILSTLNSSPPRTSVMSRRLWVNVSTIKWIKNCFILNWRRRFSHTHRQHSFTVIEKELQWTHSVDFHLYKKAHTTQYALEVNRCRLKTCILITFRHKLHYIKWKRIKTLKLNEFRVHILLYVMMNISVTNNWFNLLLD